MKPIEVAESGFNMMGHPVLECSPFNAFDLPDAKGNEGILVLVKNIRGDLDFGAFSLEFILAEGTLACPGS